MKQTVFGILHPISKETVGISGSIGKGKQQAIPYINILAVRDSLIKATDFKEGCFRDNGSGRPERIVVLRPIVFYFPPLYRMQSVP